MDLPDDAYRLSTAQLGVLARGQLAALVGDNVAGHLLRPPSFERLAHGVYGIRGGAVHRNRDAVVAALRAGPDATVTGPSALAVLDLEGVDLGTGFVILVPAGRRVSNVGFATRRDHDPARPCTRLGAVRVAPPTDALIDSLLVQPPPRLRALRLAHDRLRWEGHVRPSELTTRAAELRLPRSLRSHELFSFDRTTATGDGERDLGRILGRFDPPPEAQVWVTPHRCVDWYFRSLQLAVEYQGAPDHDSRSGRRADRVRDEELALAGIALLYVTAADLRSERTIAARVATALTSRAYELGVGAPHLRPAR
ncbi:MAG: hypothetical protein WD638_12045 [Nitriliruptoraceae bacterium]